MSRLAAWWTDSPEDPGRLSLADERVQQLLAHIAPGETAGDLGGSFSLNLHLRPSDRVLRVHRPMISRTRLLAEQQLKSMLAADGFRVPLPISVAGDTVLQAGAGRRARLAELEPFIPSIEPEPTVDSFAWLLANLGTLHQSLASRSITLPRSVIATWGTPRSMDRWFRVTHAAVSHDPAALDLAEEAHQLLTNIRRRWITPSRLPHHLVHGDFRLGNAVQARAGGQLVVFDVGFADHRPRVWDVAYTVAFMQLAMGDGGTPEHRDAMIAIYERTCGHPLGVEERQAVPVMAATALLHTLAHAGFTADPAALVQTQRPFLGAARTILQ